MSCTETRSRVLGALAGLLVLGFAVIPIYGQEAPAPQPPAAATDAASTDARAKSGIQPPGPERFATQPRTPAELWDAADYLVRSGQARLAVPYLEAFLAANPDDALLVELRDRHGIGAFLRLQDDPATRAMAQPLLDRLSAASRREAARAERLAAAIAQLTRGPDEQNLGISQLREAGAAAVPALLASLAEPERSAEERARIVASMGRLDARAVPPLIAALDAEEANLAADAAEVLGRIGDRRAVPALVALAARPDRPEGARQTASKAVERITGRPMSALPRTPTRMLSELAWRYHRGQIAFPADEVELWSWDGGTLAPERLSREDAASRLGLEAALDALAIEPSHSSAQDALLSLTLAQAARKHGAREVVANDPDGSFAAALALGGENLGRVLRAALHDGDWPLAEVATRALGRVTRRDALERQPGAAPGEHHPLIEALHATDRRVQYAAAEALVDMSMNGAFPNSSEVVPTLGRFLMSGRAPRAMVLDGNPVHASTIADVLQRLGYDTDTAREGPEAFRTLSEEADYELVVIAARAVQGAWSWLDTLTNLRADSRTAGLPVVVVGTLDEGDRLTGAAEQFERTKFLVTPARPEAFAPLLERSLARMGARPLSEEERMAYAAGAADLLSRVANQPGSPLADQLERVEPALSTALNNPAARAGALGALGSVPGEDAQRQLASTLLDSAQETEVRRLAGAQLVRSLQRFGPLLSGGQEQQLVEALRGEGEGPLRSSYSAVVGALRPSTTLAGAPLPRVKAEDSPDEDESR